MVRYIMTMTRKGVTRTVGRFNSKKELKNARKFIRENYTPKKGTVTRVKMIKRRK